MQFESSEPGRGRPREFDRDEVVDQALSVFWGHGYSRTTTRLLEDRLGLNQSSIYNAFGSKRALLDAVLDRYEERMTHEVFEPSVLAGERAVEQLGMLLWRWVSDDAHRGCMLLNLEAELRTDDAFRGRVGAHRRSFRDTVATAITAGGAPCAPVNDVVQLVVAALTGLMVSAVVDEPDADAVMATALSRRWPCLTEPTTTPP